MQLLCNFFSFLLSVATSQGHHINMCQLWALDVLTLEREGNHNTRRKILIAQERSTIDTQLAYERTTPDLVPVVRGTMLHRGGQFSSDRRGADFSRGVHWCATKELTGLRLSSVTVVSYDLVISHTKL